jgi:hypothetical protein
MRPRFVHRAMTRSIVLAAVLIVERAKPPRTCAARVQAARAGNLRLLANHKLA